MRFFLPLLLLALPVQAIAAQEKEPVAEARSSTQASPGPAIWTIHDADTVLYLIGTVHILPETLPWRSAQVEQVIAASDALVLESLPETAPVTAPRPQTTANTAPLIARVRPENRDMLRRMAKAANLPMRALNRVPPWLAAFLLLYGERQQQGASRAHGVDAVLRAEFARAGKPVSGLEDAGAIIARLNQLPDAEQLAALDAFLSTAREKNMAAPSKPDTDSDAAWARGDLGPLAAQLRPEALGAAFHRILVVDRNRDWASQIAAMLDRPGHRLIAVGAAHLVGPDSLLVWLEQAGLAPRRLSGQP